jgi:hypothetical protein
LVLTMSAMNDNLRLIFRGYCGLKMIDKEELLASINCIGSSLQQLFSSYIFLTPGLAS